jgi:hypothetical protein
MESQVLAVDECQVEQEQVNTEILAIASVICNITLEGQGSLMISRIKICDSGMSVE